MKCNHKTLAFSKGRNEGVECINCKKKWKREREYTVTTNGYKTKTFLKEVKE